MITSLSPTSDVGLELLLLDDPTTQIPCDAEDCGEVAKWSARCEACSIVSLVCQEHREHFDRFMAERPKNKVFCMQCKHVYPRPFPWLPL